MSVLNDIPPDADIYEKVWEAKAGEFYDKEHYDKIITESCNGYY